MTQQGHSSESSEAGRAPDPSARRAGILLILTAVLTAVAVVGRVEADADQPTLAESVAAIAESSALYGIGGAGRLVSGVTLVLGAWLLLTTWIIRERLETPLVPWLFALSGLFTAVSGACAVALALSATSPAEVSSAIETTSALRWITGKIGFSAAGLALIVAARYQWMVGGTLRRIAPVSAILGIGMQLIWIEAATELHRITGTIFFLWLLGIGAMLATGRVERHFTKMLAR
jgi:hypothetical protein